MKEEFYGRLEMNMIHNRVTFNSELIDWVVVDNTKTVDKVREIEDGDFLQVFNTNGQIMLNKVIERDYDSLYNPRYNKQIYNGMAVKWLPYGIDTGYWSRLFANNYRAKIIKGYSEE